MACLSAMHPPTTPNMRWPPSSNMAAADRRAASPVVRDIMLELINRDPVERPSYVASDARRKTADDQPKRQKI